MVIATQEPGEVLLVDSNPELHFGNLWGNSVQYHDSLQSAARHHRPTMALPG